MKITLLEIVHDAKKNRLHLTLLIDDETKHFDVFVKKSGDIEYMTHKEELSSILHLNVHYMMKLNRLIKAVKKGERVVFPIFIGEF